jgi:sulfate/thiosulfate transport system permease protein
MSTPSSIVQPDQSPLTKGLQGWFKRLPKLSWPWRFTWLYLTVMLFLPLAGMILKASSLSPSKIWEIATSPVALSSYDVTFVTALFAALINAVAGLVIAWVLVRYNFPGKRLLDAAIDLPFALPTAVAGITLATIYGDQGWIGSLLAPFGIKIAFTRLGVAVAMLYISLPFAVRTVEPVLQQMEKELEEAAWSLGASPATTFWRVTLPPLMPAVLTGLALGFSRAVGEFGSIVIIAGNVPFQDMVSAVLIFQRLEEYDVAGATVIGAVLLLISLLVLVLLNALQAWGRRYDAV